MPSEEIDDKPFTESTLTKLELFERYAREWLPVFLTGPPIWHPALIQSPATSANHFILDGVLDGVWGSNAFPGTRIVNNLIGSLRANLEEVPATAGGPS
ncbi:MAG: hypothetical protein NTW21_17495 [Verrucomicrobia bacterium]|nr:hypothetical protein [Verrucomicrobiota bacterium]